uniref:Doublecortin domain-containing protein 1 isoform X2 n=1 Tax=Geotrypetes seraphini TaxID=260995 RepID=A0A6P8PKM1_GEOSA|nr:doublecortin domain-containing protein 1 isoform X2 [Geotrypetes seraphini]
MANLKRPKCSSSTSGQNCGTIVRRSSMHLPHTCLEDRLVRGYLDEASTSSIPPDYMPKRLRSPYAKITITNADGKHRLKPPCTGLHSHLQSAIVVRRSGFQDCSAHQTESVPSVDGTADPASTSSTRSVSNKKRAVSAPAGQLRFSCKSHVAPVCKRQSWTIRVMAYKNGARGVFAKVAASTMKVLLEDCTEKLKLHRAAKRVFLADGTEALEPKDIPHDADIYVSTGEPFLDPFKNIKAHLLLMKKATWSINGLVLPTDIKRRKAKSILSHHIKKLTEKSTVRILVFKNGTGQEACEMVAEKDQMEKFLDMCTVKLNLSSPAKWLYGLDGRKIEDLLSIPLLDKCLQTSITPLRGPAWVSKGEGFSPSGAKIYIHRILMALQQQLKSEKNHNKELELAMDGHTGEVAQKVILSMTKKEMCTAHREVNELIDELQTAIKSYKGQLSKLTPQLQAEQEQRATYIYQHIKKLPANALLPQGMQLKVYENGKDTGETLVYISRKDLESNSTDTMQRVLQTIHQRIQGTADFSPSGLSLTPARLFDEKGKEIKNPLLLKNEQKIWVSYGEDYSWQVCTEFPVNYTCMNLQIHPEYEEVEPGSHFLQSKVDPQLVLCASVGTEKKSRSGGKLPQKKDLQDGPVTSACHLTDVWLLTKAGMILSRALTQICLAVGHPVTFNTDDGSSLGGYKLILQKRDKSNLQQLWGFGNEGFIFSQAYPEFVLTYLEGLNITIHQEPPRTTPPRKTESTASIEVLQNNASISSEKQHSQPTDPLGEVKQLTVALMRKLGKKHPKASAQRWAIKHESTLKPGQWKHSKVENPLWNKLTYMWPILPSGEINEDFDWPIEGQLIPNSPLLSKPPKKKADRDRPVRVRVLRNGDCEKQNPSIVVTPEVSTMLTKDVVKQKKQRAKDKTDVSTGEDVELKVCNIDIQPFLERCTVVLNLPSAARRLFDEKGHEIFLLRNLERDQLVYASCGDPWINPQLIAAQHKKRLLLSNLASDVSLIQAYCNASNPENLVLEVCGDIINGAKLSVNTSVTFEEETDTIDSNEDAQIDEADPVPEAFSQEFLNSHAKSHHKLDFQAATVKYPWQQSSAPQFEEKDSVPKEKDEIFFRKMEFFTSSYQPNPATLPQIHYQQFNFQDGQLSSCISPGLVLGLADNEVHSGVELRLVEKRPDDTNQRWIYREEERTFHLMSNPRLVLAVSMPQTHPGMLEKAAKVQGCPVILQTYREASAGAANQKWLYLSNRKALLAFYSTVLDQEVTAANQAAICTFCITNTEGINQSGYFFVSPNSKEKIMLCLACARARRGRKKLSKLPGDSVFSCASGSRKPCVNPLGPFKCLDVRKIDLSTSEVHSTLTYFVECLRLLQMENSMRTISEEQTATRIQPSVKIIAFKNGAGCKDGQLIIARTFTLLLAMCTRRLDLPRPACRLYTKDGALMLTLPGLVAWAVNEYLTQSDLEEQHYIGNGCLESQAAEQTEREKSRCSASRVTPEDLIHMDDSLLSFILERPIEVWVSGGEPFRPLDVVQKAERIERKNWLKKEKILTDVNTLRHKIRHLQGRRITMLKPAKMFSTKSPIQPVVVEGGWTEETPEEMKILESIQQIETHLSEVETLQLKKHHSALGKVPSTQKSLYSQPATKRVLVYLNGGKAEEGIFAWGKTIEELLANCTSRLHMRQPAKVCYTCDGEEVKSWDGIERDMILCISAGEPFLNRNASKQKVEVRANYARIRKQQGPNATNIIVSPSKNLNMQMKLPDLLLALPSSALRENAF